MNYNLSSSEPNTGVPSFVIIDAQVIPRVGEIVAVAGYTIEVTAVQHLTKRDKPVERGEGWGRYLEVQAAEVWVLGKYRASTNVVKVYEQT